MSVDASEVVVGANGTIFVAGADAAGAYLPDSTADTINAVFTEVGYVSDAGVTFTAGQDVEDIPVWQSFYPVRKIVTGKNVTCEFVMKQWNQANVLFAFGGGSVEEVAGMAVYTPPAPGDLDARALIVEWTDGDDIFRLVMPRGLVTGDVSTNIVRTASADLPISFEATPEGSPVAGQLDTQPWYLISSSLYLLST